MGGATNEAAAFMGARSKKSTLLVGANLQHSAGRTSRLSMIKMKTVQFYYLEKYV